MYISLYRKWRPGSFSDVVGQESVVTTLKNSIKSSKTAHAYLFTGTRGTGKTTCARILAKAVNCLNPKNGDPCGECEICREMDEGSLIDIIEIDGASHNKVEHAQDILSEVMYTPIKAKRKVYIIDEVHMLTTSAFNALLKTLEEPPEHVMFILATTEPGKVLQTISSRCQRFDFRRIPYMLIAQRLEDIAKAENIAYERDAMINIARRADGSMRDALSLLELCISSAGDSLTLESVLESLGAVSRDTVYSLSHAITEHDSAQALRIFSKIYESGKSVSVLISELITYYRNLMVLKSGRDAEVLLEEAGDSPDELRQAADSYTLEEVLYCLRVLCDAYNAVGRSFIERIECECCLVKLCDLGENFAPEAMNARISALERRISQGAVAAPIATERIKEQTAASFEKASGSTDDLPPWDDEPIAAPKPIKKAEEPAPKAEVKRELPNPESDGQKGEFKKTFSLAIDGKRRELAAIYAFLTAASVREEGGAVYIESDNPMLKMIAQTQGADAVIEKALLEYTGNSYKVKFEEKSADSDPDDPLESLI